MGESETSPHLRLSSGSLPLSLCKPAITTKQTISRVQSLPLWRRQGSGGEAGYLDVSAAHVVLVPLQGQVSVLLADEANQSFPIPPALSVQAERHPASAQHNRQVSAEDRDRRQ